MVAKIWQFLTTDIRELNWKQTTEVTKATADTAKTVLDLAKTVQEKKGDLEKTKSALSPYIGEISSLLDALNSPLVAVVKDAIPFAPIAVTILQLICDAAKQEPTREQCVALMSQVAYLDSLRDVLSSEQGKALLAQLVDQPVTEAVKKEIRKVGDLSLDRGAAEQVITNFAGSELAAVFSKALVVRLMAASVPEAEAKIWAQRVAWNTPRFFYQSVAEAKDKVKTLAEMFSNGGREAIERHQGIDRYLREKIQPLPQESIFDEVDLCYRDLYISLQAQELNQDGQRIADKAPIELESKILDLLAIDYTKNLKETPIVFLQGEAGQGKSVFCRMFSDRVQRELFPSFVPIVIRLRELRTLAVNLTETLEAHLEHWEFVTTNPGWLTDRNQRFLFLLDGFDELLLQGGVRSGDSGGLREFLDQVVSFQQGSHHRFLITGRPLSLQGIDRLISQNKNLVRLALCPMDNAARTQWLKQWAVKFGQTECDAFSAFLAACPADVGDKLAREPLLLYLLGRMHREGSISVEKLQGTSGMKSKAKIYDAVIQWVLEKQRENENQRITHLETDRLRQILTETALCVVQTGNEIARIDTLTKRLESDKKISDWIKQSCKSADVHEKKALNNLLTTFYIKPAATDQEGSIEFAHKSFGEFLFAERLKEAIEDWSKLGGRRRNEYLVDDQALHWELYDLLGYSALTPEIVGYLMVMLEDGQQWHPETVFERLNDFWKRWCEGEFIDASTENLPRRKMCLLQEQIPDREPALGVRQVDVFTGLNCLILLLELHRYAQERDSLRGKIYFYPSGQPSTSSYTYRLAQVIHYSDALGLFSFSGIVRVALTSADLRWANLANVCLGGIDLIGANLSHACLSCATLSDADLFNANLSHANLSHANLSYANLSESNLSYVDLSYADLSHADLRSVDLNYADLSNTDLNNVDLTFASLCYTKLIRADLCGSDLSSAKLSYANLNHADLTYADLSNANLSGADLSYASLRDVHLYSADLSSVNLRGVNLSDLDLRGVNLNGVDFTDGDLQNIEWDEHTNWANAKGLARAHNIPKQLKQQLGIP